MSFKAPVKSGPAITSSSASDRELITVIAQQGEIVRKLKASKADKASVDAAVNKLLALKVIRSQLSLLLINVYLGRL